ncbi:unnamed protein product [Rhizophagus irregularis]|nr:unnamed protein product [Rhizophagus irregularis]
MHLKYLLLIFAFTIVSAGNIQLLLDFFFPFFNININHQIIQILLKSSFINNVEALVVKREVKNKRQDYYDDYYHKSSYSKNNYYG